jgi:hypothetical protein
MTRTDVGCGRPSASLRRSLNGGRQVCAAACDFNRMGWVARTGEHLSILHRQLASIAGGDHAILPGNQFEPE